MDKYVKANQAHWDDMVDAHVRSEFYDVEGFKRGRSTLDKITLEGVGDVGGKSLLHLQCHFGLDTLSFARLGARVTGVDFSLRAIEHARILASELDIPATFVCSDVYDLADNLSGQYDIVFTSKGVLCWLPELEGWARVASHFLKPGGFFFILESHPFSHIFDDENPSEPKMRYPYFLKEPMPFEGDSSYAVSHFDTRNPRSYEWMHPVAEIINSLISAGLTIEYFREYPFIFDRRFAFLERGEDGEEGFWRLPGKRVDFPLMFSLKATK